MSTIMTHKFHKSWLLITAIVIGSFGPIFALGTMEPTSEFARWTLDLLSWPLDGLQTYTDPTTRFLSALTGGFLFGWGVMVWCLRQLDVDFIVKLNFVTVHSTKTPVTCGAFVNYYFHIHL